MFAPNPTPNRRADGTRSSSDISERFPLSELSGHAPNCRSGSRRVANRNTHDDGSTTGRGLPGKTRGLLLMLLMAVSSIGGAEEVRITQVPTQGLYTVRSHTYGDHLNKKSMLWAVTAPEWEGIRRGYCIEPGIPLNSGTHTGRLAEITDPQVQEALSMVEQLPADLGHAVAMEAMAGDDLDLRTGETRFAVPIDWGRIEKGPPTQAWRLELTTKQNLVIFGSPWDGKAFRPPVYRTATPFRWWTSEGAWPVSPILGSYYMPVGGVSGYSGGKSGLEDPAVYPLRGPFPSNPQVPVTSGNSSGRDVPHLKAPEIDASSGSMALALLAGAVLLVGESVRRGR
jgi:hypothetical protein